MTKRNISIAIVVLTVLANIYLIWRIHSNTMAMMSYDAGISQRTGVGKMESFWTKYTGASKNSSTTYESRADAEADSNRSIVLLIVLDIAIAGALIYLNKKPKPKPVHIDDDEWPDERRARRRRR
ncbi:MAG: hypothetical protein IJS69_06525 [Selenomonadaceae bacterium]|nr:hypothetical protein [Selenomonadaceae bacterium]